MQFSDTGICSLGKDEVYRHKIMALTIVFRILDFIMAVVIC